MRLASIATLLLTVVFVSAQTTETNATEILGELAQLPTCATTCAATLLPASSCDSTDFACLCADEKYMTNSEACILANCTTKEALTSQAWQKKACQAPVRNKGPLTRQIGRALLVLGGICILARFLARWRIQGTGIGWDDWTILIAYSFMVPMTVMVDLMIYKGLGQDIWAVPFDNITLMLKWFYFEQFMYQCVVIFTKISIVLLYLRIFPKEVSKRFQHFSTAVIAGLVIYCVAYIAYFAFQCRPIHYFWNQWTGEIEGQCFHQQVAIYINSAINITFDLIVFFMPIPKLSKLQVTSKRRKIGVILTFLIGLFVTVCSMVRLSTLANIGKVQNATYHYNKITLWSGLEGDVGIICACMPALAGPILYFFRDVLRVKLTSITKSSTNKSTNASVSRMTRNKSIARLPSTTPSERNSQNDMQAPSTGGNENTVVTSMYNMPYEYSSGDDVELIEVKPGHAKNERWDA